MRTYLLGMGLAFLAFLALACSGAAESVKRGDQLAAAGLHEEALAEYEQAGQSKPDDAQIAIKIAETRRLLAAKLQDSAKGLLQSGDRIGAIQALKKASEYDPDSRALETELKQAVTQELEAAKKAAAESRWSDALAAYDRLAEEFPRLAPAKVGRQRAVEAWSESLLKEARDFELRGLEANALISILKAQRVAGGPVSNSASMEGELRDRLKRSAEFAYSVAPGKPKARWVDGTARLVLKLERLEVPGCPGAKAGAGRNARMSLAVELESLEFDQDSKETTAEQKYQAGTRPVPNPAFAELEGQIAQGRAEATELEGKIAETEKVVEQSRKAFEDAGPSDDEDGLRAKLKGAERELQVLRKNLADKQDQVLDLRNKLSATPRMLDEPVFDQHTYTVFEVTRVAVARLRASARSEGGQWLMRAESFEGRADTKDKTCKAEKRYGVKADPLEFPVKDEELGEAALEDGARQLAKRVGSQCLSAQREALERARQAATESPLEAVEDYALFAILVEEELPEDLKSHLKQTRDFDDFEALRGKRKAPGKQPPPPPAAGEQSEETGLTLD